MAHSRLARIPRHLLVGGVVALLTAAIHLGFVTFGREVLRNFSWAWFARDVIWMVPLGYVAVFAAVSIPLGVLAAIRKNGISLRVTSWVWATVASYSLLLLFPRVHGWAWLIVATAIGYQVSRLATLRPQRTTRVVTRAGVLLVAGFALLFTLFEGRRIVSTQRAIAAQPEPSSEALNVLLIVWDTARAKNFQLYGYNRPTTPFVDSLARHSVVFDRAFSTAPWTLPSHASMLTGQYATAQSGDWLSPMDRTHRTLAEELRDRGYATGGFVANWLATGYSSGLHRGFLEYKDTKRSLGEVLLNTTLTQSTAILSGYVRIARDRWYGEAVRTFLRFDWRPYDAYQSHAWKAGAEVTEEFLNWQGKTKGPFFAFLNYAEVHNPHLGPDRDRFNGGKTFADRYDAALWSLDSELRRVTQELERRGELKRTIIVLTSDHGEQFDEHGLRGHGNSLYLTLLHVPLVIYAPQHPAAGERFARAVSLRDLPQTILHLAGVNDARLPGVALLPRDSAALAAVTPSTVLSEVSSGMNDQPRNPTFYGDLKSVVDDSLQIIRDGKGEYQVFAYKRDVAQMHNLAQDRQVAEWARARLESFLREYGLRPPNVRVDASPDN